MKEMKKEKKASLGGVREDGIADVRPNDLQKGLGGKMEWKHKEKKGNSKARSEHLEAY